MNTEVLSHIGAFAIGAVIPLLLIGLGIAIGRRWK